MFLTNFAKSKLTKFVFVFMLAFASAPVLLPSQAYAQETEESGKNVMIGKVVTAFNNVKLVIFIVGAFVLLKFAYDTIIGGDFKTKEFTMIALGMLLVGGVGYILEAMVGKEALKDAGIGDEISKLNNS